MSDTPMIKGTIDGVEVEVPRGTTIVRAAKQFGIKIPTFCYHPGLSIPANCRMCLVDVTWGNGRKNPKPLPGCYTELGDGMAVDTQSQEIKDTQASVLEFILLNHPVDCPICDQAGECVLQEHYFTYSAKPSRLNHEKVAKPKAVPLGPRVVLDSERCILCTRCIRVCDEVAGRSELALEERGEHVSITTFPGRQLENPYSLNTVDACPVGALTDAKFRFRRRVWFLTKEDSVCTGCAKGCSMRLDHYKGQTERVVPRYNPDVNKWWMCDDGRDYMRGRTREGATVARDGENENVSAAALLDKVSAFFAGDEKIAIGLSASLDNETIYAWAKLAQEAEADVFLLRRQGWTGDEILRNADRDANYAGAKAILDVVAEGWGDEAALVSHSEECGAVLIIDNDSDPSDGLLEALSEHDGSVVFSDVDNAMTEAAAMVVPIGQLHSREGTLTNVDGHTQRIGGPLPRAKGSHDPVLAAALIAAKNELDIGISTNTTAAGVFARISGEIAAFANLTYSYLGDTGGKLTHGGQPAEKPPRIDGTPQWEPDDVHPTAHRPFAIRRGTSDVLTPGASNVQPA